MHRIAVRGIAIAACLALAVTTAACSDEAPSSGVRNEAVGGGQVWTFG